MLAVASRNSLILAAGLGLLMGCGDDEPADPFPPLAVHFLKGWAEPLGDARDAATHFPQRIRRLKDGAVMVLVPGGRYLMGAVPGDETALDDEKPRHEVAVRPFYMDECEITRGRFSQFVGETGYETDAERTGKGYVVGEPPDPRGKLGENWRSAAHGGDLPEAADAHPVTLVSWNDAVAYCKWVGAELPSERQFEYVLRQGRAGEIYPWGDTLAPSAEIANLPGEELSRAYPDWEGHFVEGYEDRFPWTAPVRSFAADAYGFHDISGNVSEWCRDSFLLYGDETPEAELGENPSRVMRGGSWFEHPGRLRSSWRTDAGADGARSWWGFRCAKDLPGKAAR